MGRWIERGEAVAAQGQHDKATQYFLKAIKAGETKQEALNNLGVLAYQRGEVTQAITYFTDALTVQSDYLPALKNVASILEPAGQLHHIALLITQALQSYPDDKDLQALHLTAQSSFKRPRLKLVFLCLPGFDAFIHHLASGLADRYETSIVTTNDRTELTAAIRTGDIIWLEWANELTVEATTRLLDLGHKRVICRLHSYEAFANFLPHIRWETIDDLIFVAPHIKRLTEAQVPDLAQRVGAIHIVPNGVDLRRLQLADRPGGKRVAYLGSINHKKGPMLLLHAALALIEADPEVEIFIGGEVQDTRYALYFEQQLQSLQLTDKIHLEGRIHDVPTWLRDKDYILCTSVLEGHPVGLLEAMACGLTPLIHTFYGASELYPAKYLWRTIPELVALFTASRRDPTAHRAYVTAQFSLEKQLSQLCALLEVQHDETALLKRRIAADRARLDAAIIAVDRAGDREKFLALWYQHHYLPKVKYKSQVSWYASCRAMQSIHDFAQRYASYHHERPRIESFASNEKNSILFVFETFDFDNPVLRHLYNTIYFADHATYDIHVASRLAMREVGTRAEAYLQGMALLEAAGCRIVELAGESTIERIDYLIDVMRSGHYRQVVYHTGFQVSFLIYVAQVMRILCPDLRQVAFLWDYIEPGVDRWAPYDQILSVFAPHRSYITHTPIEIIRYLYMHVDQFSNHEADREAQVAFAAFVAECQNSPSVVLCTMVGQSRLRGYDAHFWAAMCEVLNAVPSACLILIGMTQEDIRGFVPANLLRRIFATGLTRSVRSYLKLADLYVDTFISGGTSLWEAYDTGLPLFLKRTTMEEQVLYNFPEELSVDREHLLVDTVDDTALWQQKLVAVASDLPLLEQLKTRSQAHVLHDASRLRYEVASVYATIVGSPSLPISQAMTDA